MAALRLVQDNIRYLALAMGDGGYVPASAGQTWSRKFGDCKGKTALLLALLHGLGIEAEPVLVSSTAGDGLNERLPQVRLFDHVIVQARIGGKSYWLDGTRTGDRRIEDLASSPFRWGLPVESAGAALEQLPLLPPSLPLIETKITYDASKGFLAPVPVTGEMVHRGDLATLFRMGLAQLGQDEFKKKAHELVQNLPVDEHARLDFKADEELGTFTVSFEGMQQMDWAGGPGGKRVLFRFGDDTIQWTPDFKREDGPLKDVPFALPFPTYLAYTETVILPHGGAGFTLEGKDLDRTIAGTHISRTLSLGNGKATAHSLFERLKPEISAADAHAAEAALKEINADVAGVRSPVDYQFSDEEKKRLLETEPTSAEGYNNRGHEFLQRNEFEKALADFDKAAAMDPQWSVPVSNRAIVLLHQEKLDEAEAVLKKAALLSDEDFVVQQGYGMLFALRDKPAESIEAFTKSLRLDPANEFDLLSRADQYGGIGRYREALADVDQVLSNNPKNIAALWRSARLHAVLNEPDAALASVDAAIATAPDKLFFIGYRGELLARFGRQEEAQESYAKAIKLFDELHPNLRDLDALSEKVTFLSLSGHYDAAVATATAGLAKQPDHVNLLISRCFARVVAVKDLEKGLQDCSRALEYSDGNVKAIITRGQIKLRMQRWQDALADFDKAVSWEPRNGRAFYGRGLAKLRVGDEEGGEKDLAAARRHGFDTFAEYEEIGLKP